MVQKKKKIIKGPRGGHYHLVNGKKRYIRRKVKVAVKKVRVQRVKKVKAFSPLVPPPPPPKISSPPLAQSPPKSKSSSFSPFLPINPSYKKKTVEKENEEFERRVFTGDYSKYTIINKLGSGEFGIVYRVTKDNKEYAMKVMDKVTDYEVFFIVYIQNQTLSSNFVVPFVEAGKTNDGKIFVVSEIMDGELFDLIYRNNLTATQLHHIFYQAFRCLAYIHSLDIVHRDSHLGNFLFKESNGVFQIKITDFGLACTKKKLRIYGKRLPKCKEWIIKKNGRGTEVWDVHFLVDKLLSPPNKYLLQMSPAFVLFLFDVRDGKFDDEKNLADYVAKYAFNVLTNN